MKINKAISNKIDEINVLCTVLIIMLHSSYQVNISESNNAIVMQFNVMKIINILQTVTVAMFFCISSYLYFCQYEKTSDWLLLLKKRIKSVLFPFVLWNVLALIYYTVIVNYTNVFDSKTVPMNMYDRIRYIINSEGVPPLWYLRELFVFSIIAPAIMYLYRMLNKYSVILIPLIGGIVCLLKVPYSSVFYWLPAIVGGGWIAKYGQEFLEKKINKKISIIAVIIYICCGLAMYMINDEHSVIFYGWRFLSVILLWIIMININGSKLINFRCFTFFAYCIHFLIIEAVRGLLIRGLGVHVWNILMIYMATIFVTCFLILIAGKIIKYYLPCIWKVLNGGRG